MATKDWRHNLPSREEQQRWKPLEWERYKEERRRYWARCKPQMLRRGCEARGLRSDGELGAVRDRLLKTDLDLGITPEDLAQPAQTSSPQPEPEPQARTQPGSAPAPAPDSGPADGSGGGEAAASEPPYVPHQGELCYSVGCSGVCDRSKECPTCKKLNVRTFFCSGECFKAGWQTHKKFHKAAKDGALAKVCGFGVSRKMAVEILTLTDLGSIAAVSALASCDEVRWPPTANHPCGRCCVCVCAG
jgi:hypothetical protein